MQNSKTGQKITNWYGRKKLSQKLFFSFILVSLIPIFIIQFIAYNTISVDKVRILGVN